MNASGLPDGISLDQILEPVRRYWGYDSLRPLQEEAIRAGLTGRDSVVVMPTGGGKSLCYQVPPVLADRTDIVVSPLISLMKDQVDGLRACDYPAVALNSAMDADSRREVTAEIRAGKYRLVFVSPERLLMDSFLNLAEQIGVGAFAIDEAHCISQWGHDFRPEYRRLALLKERFPQTSVHAYTATATQRVRQDIADQLSLTEPAMIVGRFDRPNLTYRVVPRVDVQAQTLDVIRRHHNEAVIVYCLSRKDTETMADALTSSGIAASAYHAGLSPDRRRRVQEAFAKESLNVVTATVAFGMGIDRSNVRCVIHATMPKSVEHYVQETGRAGRDGLEAECVLLYSGADAGRWMSLLKRNSEEASDSQSAQDAQFELLDRMKRYSGALRCRHRALSEYFDQTYETENCKACDVCLEETADVEDATETAQKILSCVARVDERFGAAHVAGVLTGANTERIRERGHDQLSTFGIIKTMPKRAIVNYMDQLVDQGLLERTCDEWPVLSMNNASWEIMRGNRRVSLVRPTTRVATKTRGTVASWEGVDRGLFEHLRSVRRELADERGVPAFVIFGDASLRDMARKKPDSPEGFREIHGVGEAKLEQFGPRFLAEIEAYQSQ